MTAGVSGSGVHDATDHAVGQAVTAAGRLPRLSKELAVGARPHNFQSLGHPVQQQPKPQVGLAAVSVCQAERMCSSVRSAAAWPSPRATAA